MGEIADFSQDLVIRALELLGVSVQKRAYQVNRSTFDIGTIRPNASGWTSEWACITTFLSYLPDHDAKTRHALQQIDEAFMKGAWQDFQEAADSLREIVQARGWKKSLGDASDADHA